MSFDTDATDAGGRHSVGRSTVTNLDDVFDDPEHGAVGRDRLGVHFAWEGMLLLGVIVLGYLLYSSHREAVTGSGLKGLLVFTSAFGILALAGSVSLRASAPNLAIGSIAVATSLYYASHSSQGLVPTATPPLLWALGVGAGIAVLVVGFQVPGWAGGLVGALVAVAWIQNKYPGPVAVHGEFDPNPKAYYLVGGFVVVSLVGGLLGSIKSIRRGLGRFRPVSDPAVRRGGLAATVTSLAIIGSTMLAAIAGIIFGAAAGAAGDQVIPSTGLEWTALALGAALVGGVSAFGRRGGVFGTVLASGLLALLMTYAAKSDWRISVWLLAAGAVGTGLVVTRLVETFGRPLSLEGGSDDWTDVGVGVASTTPTWSSPTADTWSGLSASPTSPSPTTTSQWGADSTDRWR
jgi:ribose/xylose/arabinose/galactoside ABC-type transport system permease subunit